MPRWLWWAPVGVLITVFALIGLRLGWIAATITETDVINRFAELYVQTQGGDAALRDCAAISGRDPGIWIVVRCTPQGTDETYEYHVNRLGGFEYSAQPQRPVLMEPQT